MILRKLKMRNKLSNLIRLKRDITVTFINHDKSRISRILNKEFLYNNDKPRDINEIIKDLTAINHDRGSKYFFI